MSSGIIRHLLVKITPVLAFLGLINHSRVEAVDLIYVSLSDNTVVRYDASLSNATAVQNSVQTFANTNLNTPNGIAITASGDLYVANGGGSTISKFNSTGGYVSSITSNLSFPYGLALDASGNLYAANNGSNSISKYNATGGYVSSISTNLTNPVGIAIDSAGNIYGSNSNSSGTTVSKFNSGGTFQATVGSSTYLSMPQGLAMDASNNLYVASYGNSEIIKFNSSGVYQATIGSSSNLSGPYSVALDQSGNIYAANQFSNTISKFDSSGTFQFSWSTGTNTPAFIAFAPAAVPEPSTYALAAIATGVMTVVARRRKARRS